MVDRSSFYLAAMLIIIVTGLTLPPADTGGWEETGSVRTDTASEGEPAAYPVSTAVEGEDDEPVFGDLDEEANRGGQDGEADRGGGDGGADPGDPFEEHGPPFIPASRTRAGNDTQEPTDERSLEYLIITPQMWKKTLNKLAKWKTQKGVVARVDTVEQCEAAYPDEPDLAASIQAYLRGAKADNENLTWVLLAGDSEYIPERFVYTRHANKSAYIELDNYAASDLYYAGLDHDWDLDNDTIYGERGEEDYEADVYVGRLPVGDPEEVTRAVEKLLMYEKRPPEGDWYDSALLAGALMDAPNKITNETQFAYDRYKDNAYEAITKVLPHLPETMETRLLYDYDQMDGLNYTVANDTLYRESFVNRFDEGHSMVNIVSHGKDDGDEMMHYESTTGLGFTFYPYFDYLDAQTAKNGDRLPLVYMSSCDTANFTERDDTGMERLIHAKNGGAIALVGGSVTTYRGEFRQNDSSFGNWWMNERFFEAMYEEGRTRPGENLYKLKEEYRERIADDSNPNKNWSFQQIYRINTVAYNLLGDPEVDIYTTTPTPLNVTFTKTPHIDGDLLSLLVLDNSTGEPVPGARATLRYEGTPAVTRSSIDGVFHATGHTDADGRLERTVSFAEEGTYTLTVTAHDHLPRTMDVPITVRADLSFPQAPADSGGGGTGGPGENGTGNGTTGSDGDAPPGPIEVLPTPGTNGHGGFLAGTDIPVNITIGNTGDVDHPSVVLGLWLMPGRYDVRQLMDELAGDQVPADIAGDDWVTLEGSPFTLTDIPAGGTSTLEANFTFTNGTWTLVALVDPYGLIRETDEKNNGASLVFIENRPPELTAVPDLIMDEDSGGATLNLTRYAYDDLDPDGLVYSVRDINEPGMSFTDPGYDINIYLPATVEAIPEPDWHGIISLEATVSDGLSIATALFGVIVNPVNDGPEIDDPGNQDATEGETFVLNLTATDIDNPEGDLRWSVNSTAVGLDPLTGRLEFLPDDWHGSRIYLNVTVTDGEASDSTELLIRIANVNDGPSITGATGGAAPGAALTARVGDTLTFTFTATDPDRGDLLKYTLTMEGEEDRYRQSNREGTFTYTPTEGHKGTRTFRIAVTDREDAEDTYLFKVTVEGYGGTENGETDDKGGTAQFVLLGVVAAAFMMVLLGSGLNVRKARAMAREGRKEGGMEPKADEGEPEGKEEEKGESDKGENDEKDAGANGESVAEKGDKREKGEAEKVENEAEGTGGREGEGDISGDGGKKGK